MTLEQVYERLRRILRESCIVLDFDGREMVTLATLREIEELERDVQLALLTSETTA